MRISAIDSIIQKMVSFSNRSWVLILLLLPLILADDTSFCLEADDQECGYDSCFGYYWSVTQDTCLACPESDYNTCSNCEVNYDPQTKSCVDPQDDSGKTGANSSSSCADVDDWECGYPPCEGYYWSLTQDTCLVCPQSNYDTCSQCQYTYDPKNSTCVDQYGEPEKPENSTSCLEAEYFECGYDPCFGYYWSQTQKTCVACPESDYKICSECEYDYDPKTKSCVDQSGQSDGQDKDKKEKCTNNSDAAKCDKCGQHFYNNQTSKCTPCTSADSFSECLVCLKKDLSIGQLLNCLLYMDDKKNNDDNSTIKSNSTDNSTDGQDDGQSNNNSSDIGSKNQTLTNSTNSTDSNNTVQNQTGNSTTTTNSTTNNSTDSNATNNNNETEQETNSTADNSTDSNVTNDSNETNTEQETNSTADSSTDSNVTNDSNETNTKKETNSTDANSTDSNVKNNSTEANDTQASNNDTKTPEVNNNTTENNTANGNSTAQNTSSQKNQTNLPVSCTSQNTVLDPSSNTCADCNSTDFDLCTLCKGFLYYPPTSQCLQCRYQIAQCNGCVFSEYNLCVFGCPNYFYLSETQCYPIQAVKASLILDPSNLFSDWNTLNTSQQLARIVSNQEDVQKSLLKLIGMEAEPYRMVIISLAIGSLDVELSVYPSDSQSPDSTLTNIQKSIDENEANSGMKVLSSSFVISSTVPPPDRNSQLSGFNTKIVMVVVIGLSVFVVVSVVFYLVVSWCRRRKVPRSHRLAEQTDKQVKTSDFVRESQDKLVEEQIGGTSSEPGRL